MRLVCDAAATLESELAAADGLMTWIRDGAVQPVSYTHLTLPTNREV